MSRANPNQRSNVANLVSRFTSRSDLHQSPMYASLMREIGWQVDGPPGSKIFYRSLGPLTIAKLQRSKVIDLTWLKHFRASHHTLTTYIEPSLTSKPSDTKLGFTVEPFAHSSTSLVDLSPDARKVLASFSQKTRYNIVHTLKKNNLRITSTALGKLSSNQLDKFFALHKSWSKHKSHVGYSIPHLRAVFKSFARSGDLHLCYIGDALVGALITLYHNSVATYYAAYATEGGYKQFAPTLLTWTAMEVAQSKGCDIFDFGGIYDPRYPKLYKNWVGFTKFKSGFRPTVISYPETTMQLFW